MTAAVFNDTAGLLVLQRERACLREGVARRLWTAGGMGTDGSRLTTMINLSNQLTSAQSTPEDWVRNAAALSKAQKHRTRSALAFLHRLRLATRVRFVDGGRSRGASFSPHGGHPGLKAVRVV
jgi:hypothetical protein